MALKKETSLANARYDEGSTGSLVWKALNLY